MPTLLAPLALFALASLPTLAAIYWLRNRYHRRTVSSLMLWTDLTQAREGGRRINRLQTPLLFLLELLALALLAFAAAQPYAPSGATRLPLLVVLDNSLSMRGSGSGPGAGGQTARRRAIQSIRDELAEGRYRVRFILAGDTPQLLGDAASGPDAAAAVLQAWRCQSPEADLFKAVALASEIGGASARILVITDHDPSDPPRAGRVAWRAFGRAAPNAAVIGAARSAGSDRSRCLIEVANLSNVPATRVLKIEAPEADGSSRLVKGWTLELSPDETRRVFFSVPSGAPDLRARLEGEDALPIDDTAILLPPVSRTIRVRISIADETLGEAIRRAVEATENALIVSADRRPHLVLTDQSGEPESPIAWTVRFILDDDAKPYAGPFVVDRTHPLTEGLSLRSTIWGAGSGTSVPGRPLVAAGNVPLIAVADRPDGRREITVRYRPDLSTFHRSPNWPILFWNLIRWRGEYAPGLARRNLRLGGEATLAVPPGIETVRLVDPAGRSRRIPAPEGPLVIPAGQIGVYHIEVPAGEERQAQTFRFAVNPQDREESDLRGRTSGEWGDWTQSVAFGWSHKSIAWIFACLAAAALTAHLVLLSRSTTR